MHPKLNILHIEDNKVDRILVKEILGNSNVKVTLMYADSIYEAQELLSDRAFDVLLLDLGLADSVGYKSIQKILQINTKIPFIVLTSNRNVIIETQSIKAGAQDYLIKSQLNEDILIRAIHNAIARQQLLLKLQDECNFIQAINEIQQTALVISNIGTWSLDLVSNNMSWSEISSKILGIYHGPKEQNLLNFCSLFDLNQQELIRKWFETVSHNDGNNTLEVVLTTNKKAVQTLILQKQLTTLGSALTLSGTIALDSDRMATSKKITNQAHHELIGNVFNSISFELNSQTQLFSQLNEWLDQEDINVNQKIISNQILGEMSALNSELNGLSSLIKSMPNNKIQLIPRDFLSPLNSILRTHSCKINLDFDNAVGNTVWGMNSHGLLTTVKMLVGFLDKNQIPISSIQIILPSQTVKLIEKGRIEFRLSHPVDQAHLKKKTEKNDFADNILRSWLLKNESILPICNELMDSIDGNLTLLQRGKTIQLNWPIEIRSKSPALKQESFVNESLSFLIVDDHFIQRMAIKKIIQQLYPEAKIDEAAGGLKAIELFHENDYSLILMDIQMPGLNGFETSRKLPLNYPGVVVAMTADLSPESHKIGSNTQIKEIISKPIKLDNIKTMVDKYIYTAETVTKA